MLDVKTELQKFAKDGQFLDAHYEELLEQYPEQWVAVFDEQVVGAGFDFEQLLDDLKVRGLPLGRIVIEKVSAENEVWILAVQ